MDCNSVANFYLPKDNYIDEKQYQVEAEYINLFSFFIKVKGSFLEEGIHFDQTFIKTRSFLLIVYQGSW